MYCYCGLPVVTIMSWKGANCGRKFSRCSKEEGRCRFWRWVEDPLCERSQDLIMPPVWTRQMHDDERVMGDGWDLDQNKHFLELLLDECMLRDLRYLGELNEALKNVQNGMILRFQKPFTLPGMKRKLNWFKKRYHEFNEMLATPGVKYNYLTWEVDVGIRYWRKIGLLCDEPTPFRYFRTRGEPYHGELEVLFEAYECNCFEADGIGSDQPPINARGVEDSEVPGDGSLAVVPFDEGNIVRAEEPKNESQGTLFGEALWSTSP